MQTLEYQQRQSFFAYLSIYVCFHASAELGMHVVVLLQQIVIDSFVLVG
jgi:hypothetical protein